MLPHLEAMLAHLEAYVGHVDPSGATRAERWEKNWNSKKHSKTRDFLKRGGGLRRQGVQPLSPTERRELPYGNATARGPLAG